MNRSDEIVRVLDRDGWERFWLRSGRARGQFRNSRDIAVDEEGTEATAATGGGVGNTSLPLAAVMNVDRPFLIVVRHEATGAILFVARVLDPTA